MLPLFFPVFHHGIKQRLKIPKRLDQSHRHCGRGTLSAGLAGKSRTPTEVVIGDMQGHRCREIAEALGEAQGQPRESLNKRADRQIVPFNVAGAYRVEIAYPAYVPPRGTLQFGWSVSAHFRVDVILDENAMPGRAAERIADLRLVAAPSIG